MHNPWAQTMLWGLTEGGERVQLGGGGEGGKEQEQL